MINCRRKIIEDDSNGVVNKKKKWSVSMNKENFVSNSSKRQEAYLKESKSSPQLLRKLVEEAENIINEIDHISKVNIKAIKKVFDDILQTNKSIEDMVQATQVLVEIGNQMNLLIEDVEMKKMREDIYYKDYLFIENKINNRSKQFTQTVVKLSDKVKKNSEDVIKKMQRILALTMLQRRNILELRCKYKEISEVSTACKKRKKEIYKFGKEIERENTMFLDIDKSIRYRNKSNIENILMKEESLGMNERFYISEKLVQLASALKQVVINFELH